MADKDTTRRTFLGGGAALGASLLAGCTGGSSSNEETTTSNTTETTTTTTTKDTSYSVEMAPVGEVTFEDVPQKWSTYFPGYADMGVALGQADGLAGIGYKSRFHTDYYAELDGVSVDKSGITQLYGEGGIDSEIYYEIDADVYLTDPQWLLNNGFFNLEKSDLQKVEESVAPFVGNTIFRRTDPWHDYRYYSMYEAFEKVAQIFQKEDQYQAFADFHDSFIADVQAKLPSAKQRPNGMLLFAGSNEPEKFYPYRISDKGTNKKHFHDLGITDALAGSGIKGLSTNDRGQIDYETVLEVDPDTLFIRGHEDKSRKEFENTVLSYMQNDDVASKLTAVQNGDVYRGGPIYQGPIQNLFLTERFATEVYSDTYSGELFARGEVSAIVNGDF